MTHAPPALHLSAGGARALAIAAQGLDRRPRRRPRKLDLLAAIRRMGVLQIDTIHVVARSPYLVLWSRVGDYPPRWLEELLAERKLFEYWAHEACFVPMEDYPLLRRRMLEPERQGWHYRPEFMRKHRAEAEALLARIREQGAVRSADFERREGPERPGWWGWKTEKRILEYLFTAGELMIARRERFQRVYDLRARVLPSWDDRHLPSRDDADRQLALKAVRALGVTTARWVADYYRMPKPATLKLVHALAAEGAITPVRVEGWKETGYIHPDNAALAERAADEALPATYTTLLSPFDPLVWDRNRARQVFGFDYALECYVPAPKRRWGYYVLPILRRDRLVGRLDAKAHRLRDGRGRFEVRALWLEEGIRPTDRLAADIARALVACARWHETPEVTVARVEPARFAGPLRAAIAAIAPIAPIAPAGAEDGTPEDATDTGSADADPRRDAAD